MKEMLLCILDNNPKAATLLRALSKEGYNGTVINTTGMHHVLPEIHGQGAAISLASMVDDIALGNVVLLIVIDSEKSEALQNRIRELTNSFKDVKGCMFLQPLVAYEGTL